MAAIQLTLKQNGNTSVQSQIGIHEVIVDRPFEKGGGNQGPMDWRLRYVKRLKAL